MGLEPIHAGEKVDAERLTILDLRGTYNATLTAVTTNPNLGADGVAIGKWHLSGRFCSGYARFLFSGSGLSAGSGVYLIDVPFEPDLNFHDTSTTGGDAEPIAFGRIRDNSAGANSQQVTGQLRGIVGQEKKFSLVQHGSNTTITHASPFTWAESDRIAMAFGYVIHPDEIDTILAGL